MDPRKIYVAVFITFFALALGAQAQTARPIPAGSKVYIAPMDGFETALAKALSSKKVPVTVVTDKSQADFEIKGASNSQKASVAKKVFLWDWHSTEEASINVVNLKSGETVYAYSVHKQSSAHGKKSSAEACAKHLKDKVAKR